MPPSSLLCPSEYGIWYGQKMSWLSAKFQTSKVNLCKRTCAYIECKQVSARSRCPSNYITLSFIVQKQLTNIVELFATTQITSIEINAFRQHVAPDSSKALRLSPFELAVFCPKFIDWSQIEMIVIEIIFSQFLLCLHLSNEHSKPTKYLKVFTVVQLIYRQLTPWSDK